MNSGSGDRIYKAQGSIEAERTGRSRIAWAVGIDLAWSPRNESGLAVATIDPRANTVCIERSATAGPLEEILEAVASLPEPLTIAIDAPTVVPNQEGVRDVDRILQRRFGSRSAGAYPVNRKLLGRHNKGIPRGEELASLLKDRLGAKEGGIPPRRHRDVWVIEVFPAAALIQLFGIDRVPRYKKKHRRPWDLCRSELARYLDLLRSLSDPVLDLEVHLDIGSSKGKRFKRIEDRIDAVLCAYVAAITWLHGTKAVELLGSPENGYVVLPRSMFPVESNS